MRLDNTPQQLHARCRTLRFWLPPSLSVAVLSLGISALMLTAGVSGDMQPADLRHQNIVSCLSGLGGLFMILVWSSDKVTPRRVVPIGLTLAMLAQIIGLSALALDAYAPVSMVALAATVALIGAIVNVVAISLAVFVFTTRLLRTAAR